VKKPDRTAAPLGDRFLSLDEAANVLRLHPRTVREYVNRGELRGRLIRRRWRFRPRDLDAFFDSARSQWDFAVGKGGDEE
jgi:excisionase family DNA binding protein